MSDEDVCNHPACELIVTGFHTTLEPDGFSTFVVVDCAMCGMRVQLDGDIGRKK